MSNQLLNVFLFRRIVIYNKIKKNRSTNFTHLVFDSFFSISQNAFVNVLVAYLVIINIIPAFNRTEFFMCFSPETLSISNQNHRLGSARYLCFTVVLGIIYLFRYSTEAGTVWHEIKRTHQMDSLKNNSNFLLLKDCRVSEKNRFLVIHSWDFKKGSVVWYVCDLSCIWRA